MNFESAYALKKRLRFIGADLDGLQVRQIEHSRFNFLIIPLDESFRFHRNGNGFVPDIRTPLNDDLIARLNELVGVLKDSNVAVGSLDINRTI